MPSVFDSAYLFQPVRINVEDGIENACFVETVLSHQSRSVDYAAVASDDAYVNDASFVVSKKSQVASC